MPKQSYTKRKDNRYRVMYKGRYFYGHTQGEAVAKRDAFKQQLQAGLREEAAGITFAVYALDWLSTYKTDCNLKTYNSYASYIERAIVDIGDSRMLDITASDIKRLYNKQVGMSKSHIDKFCMTINAVFKAAHADGMILRNPCANHKRPKGSAGSHRALVQWEKDLVVYMADKHPFGPAAMLMLFAGLRRGEMLAFNVDRDVDFEKDRVYVRRAVTYPGNQPVVKAPKTDAGARDLPLFAPLKSVLQNQHGLILSDQNGGIASETAFKRSWESYITACETYLNGMHKRWYGRTKAHKAITAAKGKLPPWKSVTIRTHDFRHTFCTMLYDAGVDLKTAQKWMGHADMKMIQTIYTHLSESKEKEAEKAASAEVEKWLKGSK